MLPRTTQFEQQIYCPVPFALLPLYIFRKHEITGHRDSKTVVLYGGDGE
jgi:hypothetical protein